MEWWFWTLYGLGLCLIRLTRLRENALRTDTLLLSHAWRLPLSWTAHRDATSHLRNRVVGEVVGAAAGLAVGTAVAVGADGLLQAAPVFGFGIGGTAGSAVTGVSRLPRRDAGVRSTHARHVVLRDYVPPWLIAGVWFSAAAAIVASLLALPDGDGAGGAGRVGVLVLVALTALSSVGFQLVGRRAVRAPSAARTDLELAWQDGLRSRAAIDSATLSLGISLTTLLVAFAPLFPWHRDLVLYLAVFVALGAACLAYWAARPARTFRRRLWDDRVFELEPADLVETPVRTGDRA
ncbi:hypothetical protein C8046_06960 [Serinibacter arcticus]|uniref:Uncharacterized protein n=1 Tax=Serinibacter arcticus TaxID=1655435 RepID=A0A2U1ZTW2_9MICO|nr:hypothetical protein [Serinibacter arcticus]PWD50424.1 hypothetical protein C8046_06960 [Serinibacter arcticus]